MVVFSLKSQLNATRDREQASLMKIKELEELSMEKVKNKELEGELNTSQAELDVERPPRM